MSNTNRYTGNKSHVGIGVTVCPICGIEHDEVVLLDKNLRNTLKPKQILDWGMCAEHQKLFDEGYIALIETHNEPTSLNKADRTGNIAHVRHTTWSQLFNAPIPEKGICFVQVGVIASLQEKMDEVLKPDTE